MRATVFTAVRCASLSVALIHGCGCAQAASPRTDPDHGLAEQDSARQVPSASTIVRDGESKLSAGDAAGARALFEQAIAENAHDARAYLDLGLTLEALDDVEGAERAYASAIENDATLSEAHNNLGVLLRDKGDLPAAIKAFQTALANNARSASAHLNLAMAFEDAGAAADAEVEYRRALEITPSDAMARANLGLLLLGIGRGDDAKRELRIAASHAQGNRAALLGIGNGLRRAGDPGGAVDAVRAAIAAGDGQPTPALLAELALAQLAAGARPAAIETLTQAIELEPGFAVAHYLIANMYAASQQPALAATHYRRYLELDPNGASADQARERLAIVDPGTGRRKRGPN